MPDLPIGLTTGYSGVARRSKESLDVPILRKPHRIEELDERVAGLVDARGRTHDRGGAAMH